MAKNISRFIQISDVVLMEYVINTATDPITSISDVSTMDISTDSHIINLPTGETMFAYAPYDINIALPTDYHGNEFFNVLNGETAEFSDIMTRYSSIYKTLTVQDYLRNETMPCDTIKLHIINGYTFDNAYGFFLKIFVPGNNGYNTVLLEYTYNKENAEYIWTDKPIYFSNRVYDKYIEIKIPSVTYIAANPEQTVFNQVDKLKLKDSINNISILYADLFDDNYTVHSTNLVNAFENLSNTDYTDIQTGEFILSEKLSTAIPLVANTDKFNLYIGEHQKGNYFEYYTTWEDRILTPDIVNKFNVTIPLYTTSKASYKERYEDTGFETYQVWYVTHDLKVTLINPDEGDNIILDNITNTQYFTDDSPIRFYYKTIVERIVEAGVPRNQAAGWTIHIDYNVKLINTIDGMQILRSGSISSNLGKFFKEEAPSIFKKSDIFEYKVYNKINNINQNLTTASEGPKVKYTKVFYDSTNINLSNVTGDFTMKLYNSPKNYKFVFTINDAEGDTKFFNFSNSYYKLYSRDKDGNDIYVDCTYSDNMNTVLGELEFYIPLTLIKKLKTVPIEKRFMSIVLVNQDNTISTLYEFNYN